MGLFSDDQLRLGRPFGGGPVWGQKGAIQRPDFLRAFDRPRITACSIKRDKSAGLS